MKRFITIILLSVVCLLGMRMSLGANPNLPVSEIKPTFFGMHLHRAATTTPWPSVPFGTWRLWDAYVAWPWLEPKKGDWHFEALDKLVSLAEKNGVEIILPLGLTPAWASTRPNEVSEYKQLGWSAEPKSIEDWRKYVKVVVARYKGRIHYYEIWNEPNLKGFFSGSVDQMLTLTREAYSIIKGIDPTATIVSPAATGGGSGLKWLNDFLSKGGGNYVDVIGYHFYVTPRPPETMVPMINQVKQIMIRNNVGDKPLWNTESGWDQKKQFSDNEAAAYVARSHLLNWASGVSRFYWYAWDNRNWVGLRLTQADDLTLTPAGVAYSQLRKWLLGRKIVTCRSDSRNIWKCTLEGTNYKGWILWSPEQEKRFRVPAEWGVKQVKDLSGKTRSLRENAEIIVGAAPLLFE